MPRCKSAALKLGWEVGCRGWKNRERFDFGAPTPHTPPATPHDQPAYSSTSTVSESVVCLPAALIAFTVTRLRPILLKLTNFLKRPVASTSASSSLISTVAP